MLQLQAHGFSRGYMTRKNCNHRWRLAYRSQWSISSPRRTTTARLGFCHYLSFLGLLVV